MRNLLERFRFSAGGYGGMLFIAVLGLAILIFGGILTNFREIRKLHSQIDNLEHLKEQQELLRPVAAGIQQHEVRLAGITLHAPEGRPATPDEIPGLKEEITTMADPAGLELLAVRHFPESTEDDNLYLRVELRLFGEFARLQSFLDRLLAWEYKPEIEGFSLRSSEGGQEMQIILRLTVT